MNKLDRATRVEVVSLATRERVNEPQTKPLICSLLPVIKNDA